MTRDGRRERAGRARRGPPFLQSVRLDPPRVVAGEYPFDLPVVDALARAGELRFDAAVTFLVGHNGSGKSTLLEGIAVAAGLNPEGGSASLRFATTDSHSALGRALVARRGTRRPRDSWFLRAESFYNVASEIDRLDAEPSFGRPLIDSYGGVSLHRRSHGESFLDLLAHRFGGQGLYLLDEPEAALSPRGALAALARMHDLVRDGSQFVVATHSPILLALPGARIVEIDEDGAFGPVDYDDAMPVVLTRDFLSAPHRTLRALLDESG